MAGTIPAGGPERQDAMTEVQFTPHEIAVLAYALWQERGCPDGSPENDWYEAERQLKAQSEPNPFLAEEGTSESPHSQSVPVSTVNLAA